MNEKARKNSIERITNIAGMMAGASIALMGIILLITYEFYHANDLARAEEWIRIAHISVVSTCAFAASTIFGLMYPMTGKLKKILVLFIVIAFAIGWFFTFVVLGKVFLETV